MTLTTVQNAEIVHLGGNALEGDPHTYSPKCWDYVMNRFGITSILDIGSGMGYAADYFHKKGHKVVAVEGLPENCEKAIFPTIQIDLTEAPVTCPVDLVHCQEVVEHIEERYIDNLLQSLANGKFIMMTHALPGQGGYHHVNEKPTEYWVQHMARYNCNLLIYDTNKMRALAQEENAAYLARSGLLFANKARL